MENPVLEARALTKRYGKVLALDSLDLEVRAGDSVAILGDAGAGKSTALRCFAGLARPSHGSISLAGSAPGSRGGIEARRRIGFLGQEPGYYGWMTARELLGFAADLLGLERRSAAGRIEATLERVGLGGLADRRIADYALPLRARLGIAQALVGEPEILLLDEPLGSLEPGGRTEILELLMELRGSAAIVIATSDVSLAEAACARIVLLDAGRVLAASPTLDLLGRLAPRDYVLETGPGSGLALAGLTARLSHEPWVGDLTSVDGALRISVTDDPRADHELLPAVVATGMTVRSLRRERPSVAVIVDRLLRDLE